MTDRPLRLQVVGSDPASHSLEGRGFEARDPAHHAELGRFLDLCFLSWPTHHHWTPGVLDALARTGLDPDLSVLCRAPGIGLVSACLTGLRTAWLDEQPVRAAYIHVVGVHPAMRRRRLFEELNQAVLDRARTAGAEVVCVQTVAHHDSARVYERSGYTAVERYHAAGAALLDTEPAARARPCVIPAPPHAPGVLSFAPTTGPAPELHHAAWEDDGGGVAIAVWPVRVRGPGGWKVVPSAEVVACWGTPTDAAQAARHAAVLAGCTGMFQAAGTGPVLPGLLPDDPPEHALRFMRPLTERGAEVVASTRAWHPSFPAP